MDGNRRGAHRVAARIRWFESRRAVVRLCLSDYSGVENTDGGWSYPKQAGAQSLKAGAQEGPPVPPLPANPYCPRGQPKKRLSTFYKLNLSRCDTLGPSQRQAGELCDSEVWRPQEAERNPRAWPACPPPRQVEELRPRQALPPSPRREPPNPGGVFTRRPV